jgi:anti-anti-sigma factor
MTPLAQLQLSDHGDATVAAVAGEVDASNAGELAGDLRELVTNRSTRLVVDLSPTRYLDSAGINLLFSLGEELRGHQVTLLLVVDPASPVARMLRLTGVDKANPMFSSLAEALAPWPDRPAGSPGR